ncbi:MAG: ComEA family DNA-binding protein [Labilithrix sp.]|nr:ComEA family DNA-binding protein [Labilithrix sp.]
MTPADRTDATFSRTLGATERAPAQTSPGCLERARALAAASPWSSLAGRVVILAVGLVVLAWIGRVATAAPSGASALNGVNALAGVDTRALPASALPGADALVAGAAQAGATSSAGAPGPSPGAAPELPPLPAAPAAPSPPPQTSHARATPEDPVFVNHASVDELRRLPGVGPKRAEAIVALRQRLGRFQRVEDLLRVKGVGRTTLRKWRALVRLDAPPRREDGASGDGGAP